MNSPDILSPEAEAWFQAGQNAWMENDPHSAAAALRRALALAPANAAIEFALGCALLKSGDLPGGYPHYNRWREGEAGRRAAPRLPIRRWSGESTADRHILIWGEDGFGDQIMYMRYALALKERGAKVSWICPPPLAALIENAGLSALKNDQPFTISDADFYCPSSALPAAFGETLGTINGEPYLARPLHGLREERAGVMTFSAPHHGDGSQKTLPQHEARLLLSARGTTNLDPGVSGARDFFETATIVSGLDLVVTVDTAVAHLAGALGIPTLIMLPKVADWRWFTGREDSPWYNSVTIARQSVAGDWSAPVQRALAAISRVTAN